MSQGWRYGTWAGDPRGVPEDPSRCIMELFGAVGSPGGYQCTRKRGYGPAGAWCKQHDPDARKAKEATRLAQLRATADADATRERRGRDLAAQLGGGRPYLGGVILTEAEVVALLARLHKERMLLPPRQPFIVQDDEAADQDDA